MVRTDHEDGGVLRSPGSGPDGGPGPDEDAQKAAVKRTSPLARRRKPGKKDAAEPDQTAGADQTPADAGASETDEAPQPEDAADEPAVSADDRTRGVSYRDRRPSVKAPVGSGRSSSSTVIIAVAGALGVIVLVAAVVLSVVFATASARIDDKRELRAEYDQFAQEVVVKLTTLNKDNADSMLDFMNKHTSGRALQEMRESMKQATDLIREDDMKTKTTVVASAVEKADEDTGSVLVVFVWESTAPEAPDKPVIETFRSRIDITQINDDMKLTNYEWVG
ncbi:hypothetical protein [Gordonia liuliyuniae]|uniref:Mce-associated membrane protein n=1 Tax=Gordonia liuliyuniae TaxID=2911517 RepID=A0ABS9IVL4_9ACTN|nr:hypothetical protein [Gordonia liuliyuniae]MCF8589606.1 hypothetical protein [Gordonia liuliyuniae]